MIVCSLLGSLLICFKTYAEGWQHLLYGELWYLHPLPHQLLHRHLFNRHTHLGICGCVWCIRWLEG